MLDVIEKCSATTIVYKKTPHALERVVFVLDR